jgi:uncharacterized membrane protein YoaK (UPF0700 family)
MHALHRPESVFSLRHLPSWLMLCFAAGAVNATTLLACDVFVTHVTGSVTDLGMEFARLTILLDFLTVVTCFVVGAMTAGFLINGRATRGKPPYFSLPLWMTSVIIVVVAVGGNMGFFGPFGGVVNEFLDFVMLSLLSFAMGLQNAAVATSTGQLVRTTHLTGPATDLGLHLADLFSATTAQQRIAARRNALLRAGKIMSFALGAGVAVPLSHNFEFLALLMPASVIVLATFLSFAFPSTKVNRDDGAVTGWRRILT